MASLSTCLFLQYFYTCLFRMSGSIRLGRPNFAIKIFFKFNHDCFFYSNLYEVGWDVKACGWGEKSMAVKIVNTAWKKYWRVSFQSIWHQFWSGLKEADLMSLSLLVLQGFFTHLINGSKLNSHAYAFIEWEASI